MERLSFAGMIIPIYGFGGVTASAIRLTLPTVPYLIATLLHKPRNLAR